MAFDCFVMLSPGRRISVVNATNKIPATFLLLLFFQINVVIKVGNKKNNKTLTHKKKSSKMRLCMTRIIDNNFLHLV